MDSFTFARMGHKETTNSSLEMPTFDPWTLELEVPSLKEEWDAEKKANEFSLTAGVPSGMWSF